MNEEKSFWQQVKQESARAFANEGVRWLRYIALTTIAALVFGGLTYFYGGTIMRTATHMIAAPFRGGVEKAKEIGAETKAVMKDAAGSVREKAGDIKDDLADRATAAKEKAGQKYDAAKEKIGENINAAKERAPAAIQDVKERAGAAAGKARDAGGNLIERFHLRRSDKPTDDVVE